MSDYGILISDKGSDVKELENILFTTKHPTAKLDTANPVSFQNIGFRFISDPPEPANPPTALTTRVATLPHGYSYTPSFWSLVNIVLPVPAAFRQDYFQESGVLSLQTAFDGAQFLVSADETNIYFDVTKTLNTASGGVANPLTGMVLRIRLYVFVEGIQ
jgi:hypothetical protein